MKKNIDDDNFFYLYNRFFESNQNFTTEYVKTVNIPGFLVIFIQNSRFFQDSRFFGNPEFKPKLMWLM